MEMVLDQSDLEVDHKMDSLLAGQRTVVDEEETKIHLGKAIPNKIIFNTNLNLIIRYLKSTLFEQMMRNLLLQYYQSN